MTIDYFTTAIRAPDAGYNALLIQMNNLSFFPTFNLIPSRRLRRGCAFHIDMKTSAEYKRILVRSSNAHHEYGLRLNQVLQKAPDSKKLLNLRRKWDNDEYKDDWACYKDSLEDRKANRKVKKRKREAHISFHEQLDDGLDSKSRQTGNTTSDNDRELVNNDDTSFTQTETTTTDNYDDSKKFVSELAPQIEIVLGDFISNEERSNDELDAYVNETIRDGNKWIVCDTDVRDLLVKWKQAKPRPRTDLAFYDIIDITPGSNSDFVQSLPDDAVQDMKQSKTFPTPNVDNVDEMKNYIIDFIKTNEFRNFVDESYLKTRANNKTKFVWDYLNILVESFERDNDLTDYNLSEFGYREIFFTPLIRSLFRGTHREMNIYFGEKYLFASTEDRNFGRKIDIIWSMKLTDLEFSIGEISGPPNQLDHSHFFNDKIKIAKMLKVIINRIVKKYGGTGMDLSLVKLYGLHVYYNEVIVYEMSIPFRGLYIFCEVMRSNEVEIGLILQSVSVFLKFKELLEKSLADLRKYIQDACTRTPDNNENAHLFITLTDLTPEKNKVQPVDGKKRK
ncbi:10615_t:CDS:10 [Ambispora leptoticha]|uniref:10615_t:CDS:1 n=1 Tax=Ambispora leptoticha TaxID=144679 RepID=A0A9N9C2M5_9GLOM|nr:10615_t:CDS:10 [Ambispora leptoticha]